MVATTSLAFMSMKLAALLRMLSNMELVFLYLTTFAFCNPRGTNFIRAARDQLLRMLSNMELFAPYFPRGKSLQIPHFVTAFCGGSALCTLLQE